ncbi:MAG: hypothetical protein AAF202_10765, partial [Pseudomonadota bacterium]
DARPITTSPATIVLPSMRLAAFLDASSGSAGQEIISVPTSEHHGADGRGCELMVLWMDKMG